MTLEKTAQGYMKSIEIIDKKIEELQIEKTKTKNLETKRKINDKLNHLRKVKRELQVTYVYLLNYYDKDAKVREWI